MRLGCRAELTASKRQNPTGLGVGHYLLALTNAQEARGTERIGILAKPGSRGAIVYIAAERSDTGGRCLGLSADQLGELVRALQHNRTALVGAGHPGRREG